MSGKYDYLFRLCDFRSGEHYDEDPRLSSEIMLKSTPQALKLADFSGKGKEKPTIYYEHWEELISIICGIPIQAVSIDSVIRSGKPFFLNVSVNYIEQVYELTSEPGGRKKGKKTFYVIRREIVLRDHRRNGTWCMDDSELKEIEPGKSFENNIISGSASKKRKLTKSPFDTLDIKAPRTENYMLFQAAAQDLYSKIFDSERSDQQEGGIHERTRKHFEPCQRRVYIIEPPAVFATRSLPPEQLPEECYLVKLKKEQYDHMNRIAMKLVYVADMINKSIEDAVKKEREDAVKRLGFQRLAFRGLAFPLQASRNTLLIFIGPHDVSTNLIKLVKAADFEQRETDNLKSIEAKAKEEKDKMNRAKCELNQRAELLERKFTALEEALKTMTFVMSPEPTAKEKETLSISDIRQNFAELGMAKYLGPVFQEAEE